MHIGASYMLAYVIDDDGRRLQIQVKIHLHWKFANFHGKCAHNRNCNDFLRSLLNDVALDTLEESCVRFFFAHTLIRAIVGMSNYFFISRRSHLFTISATRKVCRFASDSEKMIIHTNSCVCMIRFEVPWTPSSIFIIYALA